MRNRIWKRLQCPSLIPVWQIAQAVNVDSINRNLCPVQRFPGPLIHRLKVCGSIHTDASFLESHRRLVNGERKSSARPNQSFASGNPANGCAIWCMDCSVRVMIRPDLVADTDFLLYPVFQNRKVLFFQAMDVHSRLVGHNYRY